MYQYFDLDFRPHVRPLSSCVAFGTYFWYVADIVIVCDKDAILRLAPRSGFACSWHAVMYALLLIY